MSPHVQYNVRKTTSFEEIELRKPISCTHICSYIILDIKLFLQGLILQILVSSSLLSFNAIKHVNPH